MPNDEPVVYEKTPRGDTVVHISRAVARSLFEYAKTLVRFERGPMWSNDDH